MLSILNNYVRVYIHNVYILSVFCKLYLYIYVRLYTFCKYCNSYVTSGGRVMAPVHQVMGIRQCTRRCPAGRAAAHERWRWCYRAAFAWFIELWARSLGYWHRIVRAAAPSRRRPPVRPFTSRSVITRDQYSYRVTNSHCTVYWLINTSVCSTWYIQVRVDL